MQYIDDHISIPNEITAEDASNFAYLQKKGREYIEQLGRKIWTNYNPSDSGIALLEALIYGITDLELRISQPMQDILARPSHSKASYQKQFHTAKEIMTSGPISELDYRRLIIDLDGVKNAWLKKRPISVYLKCMDDYTKHEEDGPIMSFSPIVDTEHEVTSFDIRGLYSILIEFDPFTYTPAGESTPTNKMAIMNKVYKLYQDNRNLCEDLAEIKEIQKLKIQVCAYVQLHDDADEEWIDAEIQLRIEEYFSPTISAYSLTELIDLGYPTEQIFDGPRLTNGFIIEEDLKKSQLRREVRQSDIIAIIMNIPGVLDIEDIEVNTCLQQETEDCGCDQGSHDQKSDDWIICIPEGHIPSYCDDSQLNYFKKFIPLTIQNSARSEYYKNAKSEKYQQTLKSYQDYPAPYGQYLNLPEYYSIQNDLPEMYGVGENTLSTEASQEQKAKALQLKGYLASMEQILAVYFGQVSNIANVLSADDTITSNLSTNTIEGIFQREKILGDTTSYQQNIQNALATVENFHQKRNNFLDHLFARFAERFTDYYMILHTLNPDQSFQEYLGMSIEAKCSYFKYYPEFSYRRAMAFDYTQKPLWKSTELHGIHQRMSHYMALSDQNRRDLLSRTDTLDAESFYSIESILLQPTTVDRISTLFTDLHIKAKNGKYKWYIKIMDIEFGAHKTSDTEEESLDSFYQAMETLGKNLKTGTSFTLKKTPIGYGILIKDGNTIKAHTSYDLKHNQCNKFITNFSTLYDEGQFDLQCMSIDYIDIDDQHLRFEECALPCMDDSCISCAPVDFYSFRMTFVFPGWTRRFSDIPFRKTIENEFYQNLPAHILPRFCWVGLQDIPINEDKENDMEKIQLAWREYLEWKSDPEHDMSEYMSLAQNLLCKINHLNNIYPKEKLYACDREEDIETPGLILNRSLLGSQKQKES